MMPTPFPQSFWMRDGILCAGSYPGDKIASVRDDKLRGLLDCGIQLVLTLMEASEKSWGGRPFEPYESRLRDFAVERGMAIECIRLPIKDASAPTRPTMKRILDTIDASVEKQIPVYLHCWGGHGRTSTVAACYLIRHSSSPQEAIAQVQQWRAPLPKNHYPFEGDQERFVLTWDGDS